VAIKGQALKNVVNRQSIRGQAFFRLLFKSLSLGFRPVSQNVFQRTYDRLCSIAAEVFVEGVEPVDEVSDVLSGIRSACSGAKMRPAAKGAVLVGEAASGGAKQWAGSISALGERFPPGGPHALGEHQGFSASQVRGFAREAKLTALGEASTASFERALSEFGVDRLHRAEGGSAAGRRRFSLGGAWASRHGIGGDQ
jgi:hypothetical protein